MPYDKRFVLPIGADPVITDLGRQIQGKHTRTVLINNPEERTAFREVDESSLLTIIGHGDGETLGGTREGIGGESGEALATQLIASGLRKVKMITLISCRAGAGPFARTLHYELGWAPRHAVHTQVNARTGNTQVQDGKQYSRLPTETTYYRQKVGTKILYYWDENGRQQSTTTFEGYNDVGIFLGPRRADDLDGIS